MTFVFGEVVPIQWTADTTNDMPLAELKSLVSEALRANRQFWESACPLPEYKRLLDQTKDHREVIELFI